MRDGGDPAFTICEGLIHLSVYSVAGSLEPLSRLVNLVDLNCGRCPSLKGEFPFVPTNRAADQSLICYLSPLSRHPRTFTALNEAA